MTNRKDDQFVNEFSASLFEEQTSNDPFYHKKPQFQLSHINNIIEKLIHLSRFGNLLTLVLGDNGSGKSTLLENFVSTLEDNCLVCHIDAQPLLSIEQLFQEVINAFAGESTFTGIPLTARQYEEWAEQLPVISGNRLVIIDDAETLSCSVLQELCKLSAMQQSKETPHLHLILFGNYDLNITLEQAVQGILTDDGIYVIGLPALGKEESVEWLEYLIANEEIEFLDDTELFDDILKEGKGNLARIKEEVFDLMDRNEKLGPYQDPPQRWKISVIGYWFGTLTIVILSVLGVLFFQDEIIELSKFSTDKDEIENSESNQIINASKANAVNQPANEEPVAVLNLAKPAEKLSDTDEVPSENFQPQATELTDYSSKQNNTTGISSEDEDRQYENLSNINTQTISASESLTEQSIPDPVVVEPLDESEVEDAKLNPDSHVPVLLPENEAANSSIVTGFEFSIDEQFLLSEPDSNYVVQLIGLSKEDSIKEFFEEHPLQDLRYYRSILNSKPWFIIVMGSFVDIKSATVARAQLPSEVMKHGPWMKQIKDIKIEINKIQNLQSDER